MSGIMSTPMPGPVVAVARTIIGPVVISRSVSRLMVIPVTGSVVMVAATVTVSSVGGGLLGVGRMGLAASALCFGYRGGYHGQSGQESGDGFHQSVHNSDFVLFIHYESINAGFGLTVCLFLQIIWQNYQFIR